MESIADFLSSSGGIRKAKQNDLSDIEDFAKKWEIPFDKNLTSKMISFLNTKRWNGDSALKTYDEKEYFEMFLEEEKEEIIKELPNFFDLDKDQQMEELEDWFEDWKYVNHSDSHIWMSSSEGC